MKSDQQEYKIAPVHIMWQTIKSHSRHRDWCLLERWTLVLLGSSSSSSLLCIESWRAAGFEKRNKEPDKTIAGTYVWLVNQTPGVSSVCLLNSMCWWSVRVLCVVCLSFHTESHNTNTHPSRFRSQGQDWYLISHCHYSSSHFTSISSPVFMWHIVRFRSRIKKRDPYHEY